MAPSTVRMSMEEKRKVILQIYHKTKSVYMEKEIVTLASKAGVNAQTIVDINQSLVDDGLVDKEKIGGTNYFWSFPAKKDRLMEIQYHKILDEIEQLKKTLGDANARLMDAKRGRESEEEETNDNNAGVTMKPINEGNEENENPDPVKASQDAEVDDVDREHSGVHGDNAADQAETNYMPPSNKKTKTMTRQEKLQMLQKIQQEKLQVQNDIDALKEFDPVVIANYEKELDYVTKAAHRWTDNVFNCKSYLIKKRNIDKKDANRMLGITDTFDCKYNEQTETNLLYRQRFFGGCRFAFDSRMPYTLS